MSQRYPATGNKSLRLDASYLFRWNKHKFIAACGKGCVGCCNQIGFETCCDHFTGERFRHGTRLLRWRPDKAPKQCTIDQIKQKKAKLMALLD